MRRGARRMVRPSDHGGPHDSGKRKRPERDAKSAPFRPRGRAAFREEWRAEGETMRLAAARKGRCKPARRRHDGGPERTAATNWKRGRPAATGRKVSAAGRCHRPEETAAAMGENGEDEALIGRPLK